MQPFNDFDTTALKCWLLTRTRRDLAQGKSLSDITNHWFDRGADDEFLRLLAEVLGELYIETPFALGLGEDRVTATPKVAAAQPVRGEAKDLRCSSCGKPPSTNRCCSMWPHGYTHALAPSCCVCREPMWMSGIANRICGICGWPIPVKSPDKVVAPLTLRELRDQFAMAALPVAIAHHTGRSPTLTITELTSGVAKSAYAMADAMLAERAKTKETKP